MASMQDSYLIAHEQPHNHSVGVGSPSELGCSGGACYAGALDICV